MHLFDQVSSDEEKEYSHEQDEHLGHRHILLALLRILLSVLKLDIFRVRSSLELEIMLAKLELALPDESLLTSTHFKGDPHQVWCHYLIEISVLDFRHIFLDLNQI